MHDFIKYRIQEEAAGDGEGGGSLLDGGGEPADSGNPDGGSADWYLSENVKGEGEAPEYFNSKKYKTLADQAKAYPELAKKMGAYTGAPEEYELNLPESVQDSVIIDAEDQRTKDFLAYAKESGISQEFMDKALEFHANTINDVAGDLIPNRDSEMALLGSEAESRLKNISDWGMANLSKEQFEALKGTASTAEGVELIEALISKTRNAKLPTDIKPSSGETPQSLREMRYAKNAEGQVKIEVDPDYKKKVDQAYADYYGDGPAQTEVM